MYTFDKVHVEISNICNLQCSFCPEVIRQKQLMNVELFQSIIRQISPFTKQVALHLMGDPLVHPHLQDFVEICAAAEVRIFLVTNGVLLKDKQTELLLHPAFRQVNFSLHSYFDNFPQRDPTVYLQRVLTYSDRALVERPDLYINFRLWNLQDPRGMALANTDLLERISAHYQISPPQNIDVKRKKSYKIRDRLYFHFDTEFTWPAIDLPILGERGTCYGLKSHFGILVDGTVVPCCLDKEGNIPLGNITTASIESILGSDRASAILTGFRNRQLVEDLCKRCQYIDRFGRAT